MMMRSQERITGRVSVEQQEPLTAQPSCKPQPGKYLGAFLHPSSAPCSFPWIHKTSPELPCQPSPTCLRQDGSASSCTSSHPSRIHPSQEGGREGGEMGMANKRSREQSME